MDNYNFIISSEKESNSLHVVNQKCRYVGVCPNYLDK